jgi:hypothetical protein
MLFALAALLFAVWVAGVLSTTMLGGFIHLFLLFAVVAVIARLMQSGHTG